MALLDTVAPQMESTVTDWFSIILGIIRSMADWSTVAVSPLSGFTSMDSILSSLTVTLTSKRSALANPWAWAV